MIGTLGDTWGRKPAMLFSFGLMGVSVVGLALTPSYASIGWYAPLLVVLFRLLQGFALGGEVGPTTAFLLEVAPPQKRGLYVSLQNATQYLATLCAGLVGLTLASILSPAAADAWGWRIALLLGAAVVPFALIIRRQPARNPARDARGRNARAQRDGAHCWCWAMLVCWPASTIATYTMNYMTTFANHTLGFPPAWRSAPPIVAGSAAVMRRAAGRVAQRPAGPQAGDDRRQCALLVLVRALLHG